MTQPGGILITGGTGFIGRALVPPLLEEEERLTVFHRSAGAKRWLASYADRLDFIRGDIGNFSHVLAAVRQSRPRVIYHFSAMLSLLCENDPTSAIQTNAMGTFYVLEAARLFDVEQVIFASSVGTFGHDLEQHDELNDRTPQRPSLVYGVTKVFGEQLGRYYRTKYGLDFRGIRYQSIMGPGVRTPGVVQFTSWVLETCARGEAYTFPVPSETTVEVLYIKDAVRATLELARAPREQIRSVNYLLDGIRPAPSAADLAEMTRRKIPGAQVSFDETDATRRRSLLLRKPLNGRYAAEEWGWRPEYDLERAVDDFLVEYHNNRELYD